MLAAVMEALDTTIANVVLLQIRGSLSAGVDEAAWVLTSYIVANAIVIQGYRFGAAGAVTG